MDAQHYKINQLFMSWIGQWPEQSTLKRFFCSFHIIFTVCSQFCLMVCALTNRRLIISWSLIQLNEQCRKMQIKILFFILSLYVIVIENRLARFFYISSIINQQLFLIVSCSKKKNTGVTFSSLCSSFFNILLLNKYSFLFHVRYSAWWRRGRIGILSSNAQPLSSFIYWASQNI